MPQYIAKAGINHFGYIPGNWVVPGLYGACILGAAAPSGVLRLVPFLINESIVIDQVAVKITTVGTSTIQLGVYNSAQDTLYPSSLKDSTPNLVNTAIGPIAGAFSRPRRFNSGLYWFGIQSNDATVVCVAPASTGLGGFETIIGDPNLSNLTSSANNAGMSSAIQINQPYGTWPDLTNQAFAIPVAAVTAAMPFIHIFSV